jgi:hypothetical protein
MNKRIRTDRSAPVGQLSAARLRCWQTRRNSAMNSRRFGSSLSAVGTLRATKKPLARLCLLASPRGLLGIHFVHVLTLRLSLGPPHCGVVARFALHRTLCTTGVLIPCTTQIKKPPDRWLIYLASPRGLLGIHFVHVLTLRLSLGPPRCGVVARFALHRTRIYKGVLIPCTTQIKKPPDRWLIYLASPRGFEPLLQP